jgi:hypothetical protein
MLCGRDLEKLRETKLDSCPMTDVRICASATESESHPDEIACLDIRELAEMELKNFYLNLKSLLASSERRVIMTL